MTILQSVKGFGEPKQDIQVSIYLSMGIHRARCVTVFVAICQKEVKSQTSCRKASSLWYDLGDASTCVPEYM